MVATGPAAAKAPGPSAAPAPGWAAENASCLSSSASLTRSGNPAACRFAAMGQPMLPRPTNPVVSSLMASIVIERAAAGHARQAQTFPASLVFTLACLGAGSGGDEAGDDR